jgi:acyl carrier protein
MQSSLPVVTELVAGILGRSVSELEPGRPLLDEGLLDSLQVIELADALEARFPMQLDPFDLSPEHFQDLLHLSRLVDRKLEQARPGSPLTGEGEEQRRAI